MTDDVPVTIDELRNRNIALENEVQRLRRLVGPNTEIKLAIFDALPMPVWACDRDCRIVFWNNAAARIYSYSEDEAVGKDFVSLFVNKPEQDKARADCKLIIDNDQPIKNMAEDIDRHGNTRRLVTQCFAVYNVAGHSGLQVEISYEVQDIERLEAELLALQHAFRATEIERAELARKLIDITRERALKALAATHASRNDSIKERRKLADREALKRDSNMKMVKELREEIRSAKAQLTQWERKMRQDLLAESDVGALEKLIETIELSEADDV